MEDISIGYKVNCRYNCVNNDELKSSSVVSWDAGERLRNKSEIKPCKMYTDSQNYTKPNYNTQYISYQLVRVSTYKPKQQMNGNV